MAIQVQLEEPKWPAVDEIVSVRYLGGDPYINDSDERMADLIWWSQSRPVRPKKPLELAAFEFDFKGMEPQ
ncbi:hypothetical protein [Hydrogenophaga aquatica]